MFSEFKGHYTEGSITDLTNLHLTPLSEKVNFARMWELQEAEVQGTERITDCVNNSKIPYSAMDCVQGAVPAKEMVEYVFIAIPKTRRALESSYNS